LPEEIKVRLLQLRDQRISRDGIVVIKAQAHRSLERNRFDALARLRELIELAAHVPETPSPDAADAQLAEAACRHKSATRPGEAAARPGERRMSRLILAPMEGLADFVLRDVLTGIGGFDGAVSEFVRVSGSVLPRRTYERTVSGSPERLPHGRRYADGHPVARQRSGTDGLERGAGGDAVAVRRRSQLRLPGEDREPAAAAARCCSPIRALLNRIVCAVRAAVPAAVPVSAKMRLGISDTSRAIDCAQALADGGIASLVVHARTKDDGYRPPAHWEWIARIAEAVAVPVVANGEVWTVDDWQRCRAVSGCDDVMIGRGAVADPFLARRIKGAVDAQPSPTTGVRSCRTSSTTGRRCSTGRGRRMRRGA
jgi:tRNA-dihydrouridine synthase C